MDRGWAVLVCMLWVAPVFAETLLVANKSGNTVSMIDLDQGSVVATVATGEGPHEIAVTADGKLAVVTNYGSAGDPGNSLTVIEVEQGRAVGVIDLGEYTRPHGIVFLPDMRRVLVTAEGKRSLLLVDIFLGLVEEVYPTGQLLSHMLVYDTSGRRAYVSNITSSSVSLIDVNHGELLAFQASGSGAEGIALAHASNDLWVTNRGEDTVSLFDARYLRRKEVITVEGFPIRAEMMPDDSAVLVTSSRNGTLNIIDTATRTLVRTIDLGLQANLNESGGLSDQFPQDSVPIGIEVAPDGERVWIAHAGADRVQELAVGSWTQTRLLKTGREPDGMAFSPVSVVPVEPSATPAALPIKYQD